MSRLHFENDKYIAILTTQKSQGKLQQPVQMTWNDQKIMEKHGSLIRKYNLLAFLIYLFSFSGDVPIPIEPHNLSYIIRRNHGNTRKHLRFADAESGRIH